MTTATLYHAVERHDKEPDARKEKALDSWKRLYDQGVVPCHLWEYPRDARDIGDARALPYLLDVLAPAVEAAAHWDSIIVWSNDDVVFHPMLPGMLRMHCALFGACTSIRCEFDRQAMPPSHCDPLIWAQNSSPHLGRDLFAATKLWWTQHWSELGDYMLAAPVFDIALATLIRHKKGFVTTHKNLGDVIAPCEIPMGYIGHQAHTPHWTTLPLETPSHVHNRTLFLEWCKKENVFSPL